MNYFPTKPTSQLVLGSVRLCTTAVCCSLGGSGFSEAGIPARTLAVQGRVEGLGFRL